MIWLSVLPISDQGLEILQRQRALALAYNHSPKIRPATAAERENEIAQAYACHAKWHSQYSMPER